jgi:hypothetical protein
MPMMGGFAIGVLVLALVGAVASWTVGAVAYLRGSAAIAPGRHGPLLWLAAIGWPLALGQLRASAIEPAALANKAMVAFLVCVLVAAATVSLSTNLNRVTR